MKVSLKVFKLISILEAISFIVLLLIAMPVKYLLGNPELVRVVGMAHGILFVLYILGAFVLKYSFFLILIKDIIINFEI